LLPAATVPQGFSPEAVFDRVWADARDHLCDAELSSRYFTEANYTRLKESILTTSDISTLADTVNRFIEGLHVSHTRLVTSEDLEFYVYGSSWSPRRLDTLEVSHIGSPAVDGLAASEAARLRALVRLTQGVPTLGPLATTEPTFDVTSTDYAGYAATMPPCSHSGGRR